VEIIRYERHLESLGFMRAIVFREGDAYVAQCLEYDVAAYGPEVGEVIKRLDRALEARLALCAEQGRPLRECVGPAPNRFRILW